MAKKSTASAARARAARRSQTTPKAPEVTLVRQPKAANEDVPVTPAAPSPAATSTKTSKSATIAAPTRARVLEVSKTAAAAKSVSPRTPANSARPTSRAQMNRVARAQSNQRAHAASQVSPEQYAYVKHDLRLIATLAGSMFLFIIILHFIFMSGLFGLHY